MNLRMLLFVVLALLKSTMLLSQSKSDLKKYGITIIHTEYTDAELTYIEKTEKFLKSGYLYESIEFDKDGTEKKKLAYSYDKFGNITSEAEYKAGRLKYKFLYEYNGPGNKKSSEKEFNDQDKQISRKISVYNKLGDKIEEQIFDENDKLTRKIFFEFDNRGLRKSKVTMDENGNLLNKRNIKYSGK